MRSSAIDMFSAIAIVLLFFFLLNPVVIAVFIVCRANRVEYFVLNSRWCV